MNKLTTIFTGALLAVNFNVNAGDCPTLSGNYLIGKSNADFASISDAVKALQCGGVTGAVNFKIEEGTYKEQVVVGTIEGASAVNPIKFESERGENMGVVITTSTSDATLVLNGTSWVTFENLTIDRKDAVSGNAIKIDGNASHLSFKSVVFDGVETANAREAATIYFTSNAPKTYMAFEDCEINNGTVGIMKNGMSADKGTSIIGSTFFNQSMAGIMLSNQDAPEISNNVISSLSNTPGFTGIGLTAAINNTVVSNNIVNAANGTYGISLTNCAAQATALSQIVNNSVAVGGEKVVGLHLAGNTDNLSVNFNRIKLSIKGEQTAQQSYYKNEGSGNNVNLTNNILYDLQTGGYTIIGNTYTDFFNQLPTQSNPSLTASANGLMIEKVSPVK
ncbi:MAG: hypothetical protein KIS94_13440 [Chitinophagales bacterium]|nr:hypothetical protein [Chitinophagales bacterium]